MRLSSLSYLSLATAILSQPFATSAAPATTGAGPLGDGPSISRMARLPAGGVQAVETTDGHLLFITDNGRYLFRGTVHDLWNGVELTSLAQAERLAGHIDLARLKLDPADLGAINDGIGRDVVVFVDPDCEHCRALYADLPSLTHRYRFRLVPLPITAESQSLVLALHCLASTDPVAALKSLLEHDDQLPTPTGTCGQGTAQRTLVTAQILGIRGTPFLIAPDGRLHQGRPDDLAAWLDGGAGEGTQ